MPGPLSHIRVLDLSRVMAAPWASQVHRGMRLDIGAVPQVASPMRFARSPLAYHLPPPRLGEHSAEILRELGMGDAEIEALRKDGVL